jgi:chromosomal replication initiation ATPase DnaA
MAAAAPIGENSRAANQWQRVRERLERELGRDAFGASFGRAELYEIQGGRVAVSVPLPHLRKQIVDLYQARLLAAWQEERPGTASVHVLVRGIATQKGRDFQAVAFSAQAEERKEERKKRAAKIRKPARAQLAEMDDRSRQQALAAEPERPAPARVELENFDGIEATLEPAAPRKSSVAMTPADRQKEDIAKIKESTANFYAVSVDDIEAEDKVGISRMARNAAIYLVRAIVKITLAEIRPYFGNRDPKTILHSMNLVKLRIGNDAKFAGEFKVLEDYVRKQLALQQR